MKWEFLCVQLFLKFDINYVTLLAKRIRNSLNHAIK